MKIVSLIVTYQPDMSILCRTLDSLKNQVSGICIIDNGGLDTEHNSLSAFPTDLIIKQLENNEGIAKATNIGLNLLSEKDVDYVLLSDQDTVYPPDYIKKFTDYINLNNSAFVCAFCPVFYDIHSSEYKPLYIKNKGVIKKFSAAKITSPTIVFQAIASGLIIDMKKYSMIGGMNEDLFIDYVDFEWCWRVNKSGLSILCLPQMSITHGLGNGVVVVGNKKISEHNSLRYYYITRNTFYLSLYSKYLPFLMKIQLFIKACTYPIGYTIFCRPHFKNARYTLNGMIDGFCKRLGKIKLK